MACCEIQDNTVVKAEDRDVITDNVDEYWTDALEIRPQTQRGEERVVEKENAGWHGDHHEAGPDT